MLKMNVTDFLLVFTLNMTHSFLAYKRNKWYLSILKMAVFI